MCFCLSGWPTDRPSEVLLVCLLLFNTLSLLGRISSASLLTLFLDYFPIYLLFYLLCYFLCGWTPALHCFVSIFIPHLQSNLPPPFPVTAAVCRAMLSSPTVILSPYGLPVYPQSASCYPGLVQVMFPSSFASASCLNILLLVSFKYDAFEYPGFIDQHYLFGCLTRHLWLTAHAVW